jgi:tetratricopeptide (TPR) repeat protein
VGRLLVGVGLLLLCASAPAEELREQARVHYQLGREAYEKGQWSRAIDEFKKAYAIVPIPDLIYNIGRSQEQLGDYKSAAVNYRLYLAIKIDASERVQLEAHIQEIEQSHTTDVKPTPPAIVVAPEKPPAPVVESSKKPVYRRWWLWTAIGSAVAVGVGVGLGVGLTQNPGPPTLGFPGATVR